MSFIYSQRDGALWRKGVCIGTGYSGFEGGLNSPEAQTFAGVGPIPQGEYAITGEPYDSAGHGPFVLALTPMPWTNTFGRAGFLIHGDSLEHPGNASHGCIILGRPIREAIFASGDKTITVVAEYPQPNPFCEQEETKS